LCEAERKEIAGNFFCSHNKNQQLFLLVCWHFNLTVRKMASTAAPPESGNSTRPQILSGLFIRVRVKKTKSQNIGELYVGCRVYYLEARFKGAPEIKIALSR
jgi:hypothetical protein